MDVKNKDGGKLGSCLHTDGDSGAGLPPPEHRDGATGGTVLGISIPKQSQSAHWHAATSRGQPQQRWVSKLFPGMIRVKKKTPNHTKNSAGMPEEED